MAFPVVRINRSKWRFGGGGFYDFDKDERTLDRLLGKTALLNSEGYKCCLGFAVKQLIPTVKQFDLEGRYNPGDLVLTKPVKSFKNAHLLLNDEGGSKVWTEDAVCINDDFDENDDRPSLEDRENKLIALFKENGVTLEFYGKYSKKQLAAFKQDKAIEDKVCNA